MRILRFLNYGYNPHQKKDCYILSCRLPHNQLTTNPKITVFGAKRMISCDWSDKTVQNDTFCPLKMMEESSKPHEQEDTSQGTKTFGTEEIIAMALTKRKRTACRGYPWKEVFQHLPLPS